MWHKAKALYSHLHTLYALNKRFPNVMKGNIRRFVLVVSIAASLPNAPVHIVPNIVLRQNTKQKTRSSSWYVV